MNGAKRLSLALIPAMLVSIVACTPSSTSSSATATATPVKQEVTIVQAVDAESLDPQVATLRTTNNIIGQVAETLTTVAWSTAGEPKIVPLLATSWKQLNDTTWQFKLRENVRFSNGEPFDASVVKFSYDRMVDPKAPLAGATRFKIIKSLEVVDPATVNIVTTTPYPVLPLELSTYLWMVPPKYTKDVGPQTMALKPVGTGPFKLVEWVKDDHITLEANPDYWGGRPKLDKVTYRPVPEAATRSAAIQTGQADIVMSVAATDVATLRQGKGFHVDGYAGTRSIWIQLDSRNNAILKNVKVRQALNYAVDKDAIVKAVFQGQATVLQGQNLTPAYSGFNPSLKPYPFDPQRAKQLLAEAGYPNGFDMDIWTPRGNYAGDYETVQAVAGQLAAVGVRATVKVSESAKYIADLRALKLTPAVLVGLAPVPDGGGLMAYFVTGSTFSLTSIPAYDAMYKEQAQMVDSEKRIELLRRMAQFQHDEALGLFLHVLWGFTAVSDHVQGFRVFPTDAFELHQVYMK